MTTEQQITRRQAVKVVGTAGAESPSAPHYPRSRPTAALAATAGATAAKLTPELTKARTGSTRCCTDPAWSLTAAVAPTSKAFRSGSTSTCSTRPRKGRWTALRSTSGTQMRTVCTPTRVAASGGGSDSAGDTISDNWLRGYQITGKDRGLRKKPVYGQVSFETIWPGWYAGRAIHIHVRVRKLHSSGATIAGYTTQIFFSDTDNAHVLNERDSLQRALTPN